MFRLPYLPFGGSVDQIAVATGYLDELRQAFRETAGSLRAGTEIPGCSFDHFPKTEDSFGELHGRWDERRRDLAAALDGAAGAIQQVSDSFEELDRALADQLRGK